MAKRSLQFYVFLMWISVLLRLRQDFVIRMVVRKEGLIYMLLCKDFVKFDV